MGCDWKLASATKPDLDGKLLLLLPLLSCNSCVNGAGTTLDVHQFGYTLVEKRFHRGETVEQSTESASYLRMLVELPSIPSTEDVLSSGRPL